MKCSYCNTENDGNRYHAGTCDNCGASFDDHLEGLYDAIDSMTVSRVSVLEMMRRKTISDGYARKADEYINLWT